MLDSLSAERVNLFFTLTGLAVIVVTASWVAIAYFVIKAAREVELFVLGIRKKAHAVDAGAAHAVRSAFFMGRWGLYAVRDFLKNNE